MTMQETPNEGRDRCWRCRQRIESVPGFGWKTQGTRQGFICPQYDRNASSTMEHEREEGSRC